MQKGGLFLDGSDENEIPRFYPVRGVQYLGKISKDGKMEIVREAFPSSFLGTMKDKCANLGIDIHNPFAYIRPEVKRKYIHCQ